jgi:transposase
MTGSRRGNPVRAVDAFVDALDLAELGFKDVEPAATGRPGSPPTALEALLRWLDAIPSHVPPLRDSLHRQPVHHTVWMVIRQLNTMLPNDQRKSWLSELRAAAEHPLAVSDGSAATDKKKRRQLPPGLPRHDIVRAPAGVCKACGGTELRRVGESVTEVLEYIPGHFEVARQVRPAVSCRKCEAMMQAPMPDLPIPRGLAGASLLAHVATSKFCDRLPLYRQAQIYARGGVDLDRGQLAEWLGHVAWLLKPLGELIASHVMAGRVIHADDTPVPVLAPGAGRTKTGRQWVYLRDERPHGGTAPPAVLYRYTPNRKGEHCRAQLVNFPGWLHADGYAGFGKLYEIAGASASLLPLAGPPRVAEVACWAHVRRGFFDEAKGSGSPIAKDALERIGALFDIERQIKSAPPGQRRNVRQRLAKPRLDELATWLDAQLQRIPGKSDLAGAIRYARSRWPALTAYVDHGQLEISHNAAENATRPCGSACRRGPLARLRHRCRRRASSFFQGPPA